MDIIADQIRNENRIAHLQRLTILQERKLMRSADYGEMVDWSQMTIEDRSRYDHMHEQRAEEIAWTESEMQYRIDELGSIGCYEPDADDYDYD